jgi:hypothetical protein
MAVTNLCQYKQTCLADRSESTLRGMSQLTLALVPTHHAPYFSLNSASGDESDTIRQPLPQLAPAYMINDDVYVGFLLCLFLQVCSPPPH